MDCFAEPVSGRRFAPTRWLAMTLKDLRMVSSSRRLAPEALRQFHTPSIKEGAGKAGCRSHPRSCV
jgi:hypothetical protein